MSLGLYLWKEWRDQRAGLGRLALVLVLLALAALALPQDAAGDPIFVACFVGAAFVLFALSVGSDLLAGELARGRVAFLERLPGGLSAAFAGKLALFVLAAGATLLAALGLALGVARVRAGAAPELGGGWLGREAWIAGSAVLLWTFAASTWVPRSALALPVSLAVIAALTAPLWHAAAPLVWYEPAAHEVEVYGALAFAGAPLSAWASFALGYRRGGGPLRAFASGIGVAALVLLPAWSWTGIRAWSLLALDPNAAAFCIRNAVVGEGGRVLFATCTYEPRGRRRLDGEPVEPPLFAVTVDLADGSFEAESHRVVAHGSESLGFGARAVLVRGEGGDAWLDGRTAEPLPRAPRLRAAAGTGSPLALGDPGGPPLFRQGLGIRTAAGLYDPARDATFPPDAIRGADGRLAFHHPRPGDWIARETQAGGGHAWVQLDPESGATRPVAGLREGDFVCDVVPDGRLLVSGGEPGPALLDPETGERTDLVLEGAGGAWSAAPLRAGDPLAVLVCEDDRWAVARLDPARGVLRAARGTTGPVHYLGSPDGETAYVVEARRRVVRVRFGTDEREVVFPR